MPKPLLTIVFSLLAATSLSAADWREVNFAEGSFRIEFPAEPKHKTRDVEVPGAGKIRMRIASAEVDDVLYTAIHSSYPKEVLASRSPDQLLENAVAAVSRGRRVLSEEPAAKISLGKYAGRALDLQADEAGQKVQLSTRLYLVENGLIQVIIGKPEPITTAERDRFFSSLKLLDD